MSSEDLDDMLTRVAHWLPTQGPLKDFVHHNTLHAFQHLKFDDGVAAAARLYGALSSMPGAFYWSAYRAGQITESSLERALEMAIPDAAERATTRAAMVTGPLEGPTFTGLARSSLRRLWKERMGGIALERRSQLHVLRMVSAYLDQGLAHWHLPGAEEVGLFAAVSRLAAASALPLRPFNASLAAELLKLPARDALAGALERTVGRADLCEPYLLESLLTHPGWAGLVGECERKPEAMLDHRNASLLDYAALVLVAEVGCLEEELGPTFAPLAAAVPPPGARPRPDAPPARSTTEKLLAIWQNAFEWSYYEPLLGALESTRPPRRDRAAASSAWAFFCLDDRACSVRRHLEEVAPCVATFGTAGFFGLDFVYRGAHDAIASKHCPAPMVARHLVVEEFEAEASPSGARSRWWRPAVQLDDHSGSLLGGWLKSYLHGVGAGLRLAAEVLWPSLSPAGVVRLNTVSAGARFRLVREGEAKSPEGLWLGYTIGELADRLAALFRSVGVDGGWPELVVVFGHGASSVNNPYFAAYNCGACSGRAGAPNARAFAKAANRPDVRAALRTRGVQIPETTWFVGALYDTTRDEATYYDVGRMPDRFNASLEAFRRAVEEAAMRNAVERCRRFDTVPLDVTPEQALQVVRRRSVSLFEPRPEYNHATNASCVIGRRGLTDGLFLDRRAFLSSYDPTRDPSGETLVAVLRAVVPVCAGINLEYYFSRLDPRRYGAGTKLPHNVNGLLGVCNGIESDLLNGLPTQMTEIHDPVRLLIVVEHAPEIALAAVKRDPSVLEWIENEWVRYACVDPGSRGISLYVAGEMRRLEGLPAPARRWPSSLAAAREGREALPIGFIEPDPDPAKATT
jgi:uncharacterized protein YbcC (UPF0753/DUF2309 family)